MNFRRYFYISLGIIAGLLLLFLRIQCQKKQDQNINSVVLKPNEKEKILVNPQRHTISVVTHSGVSKKFMPSRPFSIVEDKQGKLSLLTRDWGTEIDPLFGFSYGDDLRVNVGASFFYYKNFDFNGQLGLLFDTRSPDPLVKPLVSISYNVYSNTNLFVGTNPFRFGEVTGGIFWRW